MRTRFWVIPAAVALLFHPSAARADIRIDSAFQALFDALPTLIAALLSAILGILADLTIDPLILGLDFNGDGV